jgi:hypothetical protein
MVKYIFHFKIYLGKTVSIQSDAYSMDKWYWVSFTQFNYNYGHIILPAFIFNKILYRHFIVIVILLLYL